MIESVRIWRHIWVKGFPSHSKMAFISCNYVAIFPEFIVLFEMECFLVVRFVVKSNN